MTSPTLIKFDDRLYFTTFPSPIPSASSLNKSPLTRKLPTPSSASSSGNGTQSQTSSPPPSSGDEDDASRHELRKGKGKEHSEGKDLSWIQIDTELVYQSFAKDFGPLNIAMVYKFCIHIHDLLQKEGSENTAIVLYSSSDPQKKANAALLMALYVLIVQRKSPWEAFYPIADIEFVPFRDAGRGRGDFNLSIQDCLFGVWKALKLGLLNLEEFDIDEYCFYERVENGDFNWVSKDFIAFASPQDNHYVRSLTNPKATSHFPNKKHTVAYENVLTYFTDNRVKLVIRLNNPLYDQKDFESRGIEFKDCYFDDGTNPPTEMVREFLADAQRIISKNGVIAIHCKAGLGRTGCLIAAWLIYKHSFTAQEAIGFMRICRPGMVVGPQQQYILLNHLEWVKWAAADEAVAAYKATLAANSSPTRAITPPSDERFARSMPQVTPARYVASSNAAAANAGTPPGQPRKTPLAKRTAAASLDEDDVDADPLGRAPPHKYQRAKSDDSDIVLSPGRPSSSAAPAPPKASALLASPAKGRKPPSRIAVSTRRGPAPATESKVRGTLRTGNYNVPASPIASGSGAPSRLPMLKGPPARPFGLSAAAGSPATGVSAVLTRGEVTRMTLVKEKQVRTLRKRRSSLSQTDIVR